MAYFLYTLSVFLACGVLEDCEAYFFAVRKNFLGVNFGETKRGYSLKAPCKGVLNVLYPPKEVQNF